MNTEEVKVAIYSRKSRFTGKGESIGNQIVLCQDYVRINFGEEAAKNIVVYEDEGFSGGNLNRPGFKRMMAAAQKRKFNKLIVYRLDRISRNISDFSGLINELSRLDIDFISINEQFDTSTPMGRAMMYIASVFAQLERETIAERIRDNMRELAKTGRWLGGVSPTGYTSEAVKSVTIDGKMKRACKLKIVPEEAEIVRLIYAIYEEKDSLTMTEAELFKRGIKTKNGNEFTRFSIKGILQNPVYLIADDAAYEYFSRYGADLFSGEEEFDGKHGIMAYNRTDQEKGRATKVHPVSEWIVSVGKHPGLISGRTWVKIQESLDRNKSKAFRKPKKNEALLTGMVFCRCGSRMYPRLSRRLTEDGQPVYTYVCSRKERSKKVACDNRNATGNILDSAVIKQIKLLCEDSDTFVTQMADMKKICSGRDEGYEQRLAALKRDRTDVDRKIKTLVDSIAEMEGSTALTHVMRRIEELNMELERYDRQIEEMERVTANHALSDIEFDVFRQMLAVFKDGLDSMTIDQKRAAIRTVVRKVMWDGTNAHVVLFGVQDDEIEFPPFEGVDMRAAGGAEDEDDLEPFSDVEYEHDGEGDGLSTKPITHPCEDSKRNFDALPVTAQNAGGSLPVRRH